MQLLANRRALDNEQASIRDPTHYSHTHILSPTLAVLDLIALSQLQTAASGAWELLGVAKATERQTQASTDVPLCMNPTQNPTQNPSSTAIIKTGLNLASRTKAKLLVVPLGGLVLLTQPPSRLPVPPHAACFAFQVSAQVRSNHLALNSVIPGKQKEPTKSRGPPGTQPLLRLQNSCTPPASSLCHSCAGENRKGTWPAGEACRSDASSKHSACAGFGRLSCRRRLHTSRPARHVTSPLHSSTSKPAKHRAQAKQVFLLPKHPSTQRQAHLAQTVFSASSDSQRFHWWTPRLQLQPVIARATACASLLPGPTSHQWHTRAPSSWHCQAASN